MTDKISHGDLCLSYQPPPQLVEVVETPLVGLSTAAWFIGCSKRSQPRISEMRFCQMHKNVRNSCDLAKCVRGKSVENTGVGLVNNYASDSEHLFID